MPKIEFTKMVATGNDFVLINQPVASPRILAQKVCDRKYGVGADGLLLLGKSKRADVKMRVFNADGSEAEMCGNGARCAALSVVSRKSSVVSKKILKIETKAGIVEAETRKDNVGIKLTSPKEIKLDIPIKINNRMLKVNFINTGVPHAVIFVEGLERMDVVNLGRQIRNHSKFAPRGTNVDFVEVSGNNSLKVRTYERGVEDETLACGTGAAASALLYAIRYALCAIRKIDVYTQGGEILKIYFDRVGNNFKDVWLEGKV